MSATERWRLYGRVWMVVQCAEGEDAVERLNQIVEADFVHLVRDDDMRVVAVTGNPAGEAQLQIRLPMLHNEFGSFDLAHIYATEHGLTDCVIVRKGSHHDTELQTYGKVPMEPYVITPA